MSSIHEDSSAATAALHSQAFSPEEIAQLRSQTPGCEGRIHLNNAGAGLMSQPVLDTVREHLELEARVGGYEAADLRRRELDQAYEAVARLLGTRRRNVAMVENTTAGFALALSAFDFQPGDVILLSRDDYTSNQIQFLSLGQRLGVRMVRIPDAPEGGLDPAAAGRLMEEHRPRLVTVSHVPTQSGLVQPVEELGRRCREHGVPLLVDACQSIGQLPVDVEALGCDFLCASTRKFLRGPRGMGFLYVSDRALEAGRAPLYPDLHGAQWTREDGLQLASDARRFENWEFSYALILGTGVAAAQAVELGLERLAARIGGLAEGLRQRLQELDLEGQSNGKGLRVLDRGPRLCGIVTVELPGQNPGIVEELRRQGLNTSASLASSARLDFQDKGVEWALRLSPHAYNTEDELDRAVEILARALRS
ncbi:MAG: aminotransferase class V-fold PLP-dependent enzyme [Acidobacteriota bacterium]|nr:aminotransferase class V-fold PLP-dependent enzyme [Acidobacteriota bacterium]